MTCKTLLYVPFTGLGLANGMRGNVWLRNRIEIFKKFVLPAMLHQRNRDFSVVVSWRPEERENPLVEELERMLSGLKDFSFIFVYGGILFLDDKYDEPVASERLRSNLSRTLPELRSLVEKDESVLFLTWPSDDCYLSTATRDIWKKARELDVDRPHSIGYREGYILNMNTLELAEYARGGWKQDETSVYHTATVPPFFAVLFPRETFLNPQAHMDWIGPYRSHEYIGEHTEYHALDGPGFIVGVHGENISTTWHHRYRGRTLEGEEREKVLLQAGLFDVEPLALEKGTNRKWFNKLPAPLQRFWLKRLQPTLGSAVNGYKYFRL